MSIDCTINLMRKLREKEPKCMDKKGYLPLTRVNDSKIMTFCGKKLLHFQNKATPHEGLKPY